MYGQVPRYPCLLPQRPFRQYLILDCQREPSLTLPSVMIIFIAVPNHLKITVLNQNLYFERSL